MHITIIKKNSTIGKQMPQLFKFLLITTGNEEEKVWFATFICPSVCG
jgi:hypothetical protein